MQEKLTTKLLVLAASVFLTPLAASAQLPEATGREIALSQPQWKLFIPEGYQQRVDERADLLVHFHGHPPVVRNNALWARLNVMLVTANYNGLSRAYSTPFSDPALFQQLLDESLAKVQAEADFPDSLHWDRLVVSSFSAGYGAVREILKQQVYRDKIDALVAADSLYATTAEDGTPLDEQMVDYKRFAKLAAAGKKTFLFSYSMVPTEGYEMTVECGAEILEHLGIAAKQVESNGLGQLSFNRQASEGNFHYRGTSGTDGEAHMAHLRFIGEFYQNLPVSKRAAK